MDILFLVHGFTRLSLSFRILGALRLFRRIVQLKDEMYNRHIVRERLFDLIGQCFRRNGHRYNLLNSAILELFEFIRTVNIEPS